MGGVAGFAVEDGMAVDGGRAVVDHGDLLLEDWATRVDRPVSGLALASPCHVDGVAARNQAIASRRPRRIPCFQ